MTVVYHYKFVAMIFCLIAGTVQAQTFNEKVTTESNVAMTINSLGIIGNSFNGSYTQGKPSCKYPRLSDIEHLFNGGLWIGGIKNGETRVSTGAYDSGTGYTVGGSNYEFVAPFGAIMQERSSLLSKQDLYSPYAISHQDFLSDFTDTAERGVVPGTQFLINGGNYTPLGLKIHMETYNWNYPYSNFFVILNFRIINSSKDSIVNPYIGYWADGVVRNVRLSPTGTANFFGAGGNGYMDSLQTSYEFDANGDTATTRSYFALKYLGADDRKGFRFPLPLAGNQVLNENFKVNYNSWQFRGTGDLYSPKTDADKYGRLSSSMTNLPDWATVVQPKLATPFNRSNLISAGPFTTMMPGDTINVAFAVILANRDRSEGLPPSAITKKQLSLLSNASKYVQSAFNGNDRTYDGIADDGSNKVKRFVLPSPPNIPKTKVVARDHAIDIYWDRKAELSVDAITGEKDFEGYRIYKTKFGYDVEGISLESAYELLASYDTPNNSYFYNNGFSKIYEPTVIDGDSFTYKYTINNLQNGWQHGVALEVFDKGNSATGLPSLSTGPLNNQFFVYTGAGANGDITKDEPFAYPNPYYGTAAWDKSTAKADDRRMVFANLPKRCTIRILTAAGDLVDEIKHDELYGGEGIKSIADPSKTIFAGGEHYWNLLSSYTQIISRGMYIFTVTDAETGKIFKGTFTIIK